MTVEIVDSAVLGLERTFQSIYGTWALSAASKFLWIKHRSPVVIYDGQAYDTLRALGENFGAGKYTPYRAAWLRQFTQAEEAIHLACDGLVEVKRYSLAASIPDDELSALVKARWFHERVFDKYLWRTGA